jgi:hypothetical protein
MRALLIPILLFLLAPSAPAKFVLCCDESNDLFRAMPVEHSLRAASPDEALNVAPQGGAVLVLADGYPDHPTVLPRDFQQRARDKDLRIFVEFTSDLGDPSKTTTWERGVVTSDFFGHLLPRLRILALHDCRYIAITATNPHLVISRVAGYDTAVYGVAKDQSPLLLATDDGNTLIAATKLSNFLTARYAPAAEWKIIWQSILHHLAPNEHVELNITPTVHPALGKDEPAPPTLERDAFTRAARFYTNSKLLVSKQREPEIHRLLAAGVENIETPKQDQPADGTLGILEGYSSQIRIDGSQQQRAVLRADCNAEAAMVLALGDGQQRPIAANLLDFVFSPKMQTLGRLDPRHPAFGLIAWGAVSPAWMIANYGDDNARVILAAILASASLKTDRFDEPIVRALYANLRTTGTLGFRGDRIDIPALEQLGWKHFHDAETTNFSPHFEAGLWACNLWAYRATGDRAFLTRTATAIAMMMDAYAKKEWRWMDNIERSRMLLTLAWLVRIDDTPEHRRWLYTIASDLLDAQHESGAIAERFGHAAGGHFQVPASNEAYGTTETPLIQKVGDPVSDQLYTTGFALFALHEAVAAGFSQFQQAEDKLADYLCRIQVRSDKHKELDGGWFRAFDFGRWDYWASSADAGWGAWSMEAGWAPAWTAATLALRQQKQSFWDMTAASRIKNKLEQVQADMSVNDGSPLKR